MLKSFEKFLSLVNRKNSRGNAPKLHNCNLEFLEERALLSVVSWDTDTQESLSYVLDTTSTEALSPQVLADDLTEVPTLASPVEASALTRYVTPEGYNSNDYQKIVAFFEQTDSNGVKNGAKCHPVAIGYDPSRPNNFPVNWKDVNGERRAVAIHQIDYCDLVGNMDLSGMTYLEYLYLNHNNIKTLDVSGCTSLKGIECNSNQLTDINLTGCTALNQLYCNDNRLTYINFSSCPYLTTLECNSNRFTTLNVSNLTNLTKLKCESNNMRELNASGCINLMDVQLDFNDNPLEKINFSGCTKLIDFHYNGSSNSYTSLKELDVSGCTNLKYVFCYYGQLTSLNVSGCVSLIGINCSYNQLTSLDLRNVSSLDDIYIAGNPLLSHVFLTKNDLKVFTVNFDHSITWDHNDNYHDDDSWDIYTATGIEEEGINRYSPKGLPFHATNKAGTQTIVFASLLEPTIELVSSDQNSITVNVGSVANASGYRLECSTDPSFGADVKTQSAQAGLNTISNLNPSTTYYLRVKALGSGSYSDSDYSTVISEKTGEAIAPNIVTTKEDVVNANDGKTSLREAVANAKAGDHIYFSKAVFKAGDVIQLKSEMTISTGVIIDASDFYDQDSNTPGITIKAASNCRHFTVSGGTDSVPVTFIGLGLTGGYTSNNGGSILAKGTVKLQSCSVYDNYSGDNGGAISSNNSGTHIYIVDSTLTGNEAKNSGGSVYMGHKVCNLYITSSLVAGNKAYWGGGFYVNYGCAEVTLLNSVLVGNKATCYGAGYNYGQILIYDCTIAGNTASYYTGGIKFGSVINTHQIKNSIIALNTVGSSANDLLPEGHVTVNYSLIGNASVSNLDQGTGNLMGSSTALQDPGFVNLSAINPTSWTRDIWKNWNYSLTPTSAAVNAGSNSLAFSAFGVTNSAQLANLKDQQGNSRLIQGTIDMGACEYDSSTSMLATPTLNIGSTTSNSITLIIGSVANASGYRVQYSTDSTFSSGTKIDDGPSGTRTISGLNPNTKYYFRVQALGSNGYTNSAYSAKKSGKTDPLNSDSDLSRLRDFLELADSNGVKNGKKVNSSYNANDTSTWGVTWSGNQVTKINWADKSLVGSLNLSDFSSLTELNCNGNQLTALDVSGCISLKELYCRSNQLTSLNVSGCSALEWLRCNANPLTSVDVSDCTGLLMFWCENPELNSVILPAGRSENLFIYLSGIWTLKDANNRLLGTTEREYVFGDYSFTLNPSSSLPIYATNGTQSIAFVSNSVGVLAVPTLSVEATGSDTVSITVGSVANSSGYWLEYTTDPNFASNVTGMKFYAGKRTLGGLAADTTYYFRVKALGSGSFSDSVYSSIKSAKTNPVPTVNSDVSLVRAFLEQTDNNGVKNGTKINSSYNPNDTSTWNGVTWTEVGGVKRVKEIGWFFDDLVGNLDLSGCTAMTDLYCSYNGLTSVNVSGCTALEDLDCSWNGLTSLNISGCTALQRLGCQGNNLTSLNVSGYTALTDLYCSYNELTSLNVSGCTALTKLWCNENQLTSLDVSKNTALEDLDCSDNLLTSLDLSKNTELLDLSCKNNQINTLDVSKNTELGLLRCWNSTSTYIILPTERSGSIWLYTPDIWTFKDANNNILGTSEDAPMADPPVPIGYLFFLHPSIPLPVYTGNESGTQTITLISTLSGRLAAPALSFNSASYNSISVNVGSVPNASGYQLEYSTNASFTVKETLTAHAGVNTISNLSPNTKYYIRVKALGTGNYSDSPYSTTISATTNNLTKLSAPSLSVSVTGSASVSVTVGSVANASRYRLQYSTSINFSSGTNTIEVPAGTKPINDLNPNTTYFFRVMALGSGSFSDSDYSAVKSATTNKLKLAEPYMSVSEITTDSISVNISSMANASKFLLEYSTDASFSVKETLNAHAGINTFNGLEPNTKYYIRAKALGSGDYSDSDYCSTLTATTKNLIKLSTPTLFCYGTSTNSIAVNVSSVAKASGYLIEYSTNSNFTDKQTQNAHSGINTIGGLYSNTNYFFRVMAIGSGDYLNSDYSATLIAATNSIYKLATPSLSVTANGINSVSITVDGVENAVGYKVQYATDPTFATGERQKDVSDGVSSINDLKANTTYYFRVKALGSGLYVDSEYSGSQSATTFVAKLNTPTLSVSAAGSNAVYVKAGSVPGATAYKLEFSTDPGFTVKETRNVLGGRLSLIKDLNPNQTYYFRVMAIGSSDFNDSDYSSVESVVVTSDYIASDADCLLVFLEQTDANGVKNGTKINRNYDPDDIATWSNVLWKTINGTQRITNITWNNLGLVGSLNLSGCTSLTSLSCYGNQLTSLNVAGCSSLQTLHCKENQLISLNLTGCNSLTELFCASNQFTKLNVKPCSALVYLDCWSPNLETVSFDSTAASLYLVLDTKNKWTFKDARGRQLAVDCILEYRASNSTALPVSAVSGNQTIRFTNTTLVPLTAPSVSIIGTGTNSVSVNVGSSANASGYILQYSTDSTFTNGTISMNVSAATRTINGLSEDTTYYFRAQAIGSGSYINSEYSETTSVKTYSPFAYADFANLRNFLEQTDPQGVKNGTKINQNYNVNDPSTWNVTWETVDGFTRVTRIDWADKPVHGRLVLSGCTALTELRCGNNSLTELNVSGCTALKELVCYSTQLTTLDVSTNTALEHLDCNSNSLTSLDVSNNTALVSLLCGSNQLTSLDVSNNTQLLMLECAYNQLTSLDISKNLALTTLRCWNSTLDNVKLSSVRDNPLCIQTSDICTFKNADNHTFGTSTQETSSTFDGYHYSISPSTALPFYVTNASQTHTIEFASTLSLPVPTLSVSATGSNSVSVSVGSVDNASGYTLQYSTDINFGSADTVDISAGRTTINELRANTTYYFRVKALGIGDYRDSAYSRTKSVQTDKTRLSTPTLGVSISGDNSVIVNVNSVENAAGYTLQYSTDINFSSATTLNISAGRTTLNGLRANTWYYFRVKALGSDTYAESEYSAVKSAKTNIAYSASDISSLKTFLEQTDSNGVKNGTKINSSYDRNDVSTWDVVWEEIDGILRVTEIVWWNKQLVGTLDLSGCTTLTYLDCDSNQLTKLNVSGCTALTDLNCYYNKLTSLNASGCTALTDLYCYSNELTTLNVSGCTSLVNLYCYFNALPSLNVSDCSALKFLWCSENQLASLDVSHNTRLVFLWCYSNELTSLDVSKCLEITSLLCDANHLTRLDLSKNTELQYLVCYSNQLSSLDLSKNIELSYLSCWNSTLGVVILPKTAIRHELNVNMWGSDDSWTYVSGTDYLSNVACQENYQVNSVPFTAQSADQLITFVDYSIDRVGDSLSTAKEVVFANGKFTFTDKLGEGKYGPKDVDFYKFVVSGSDVGKSYTFTTSKPSGGSFVDTYIRLFDAIGQYLDDNDDTETSYYSALTWKPTAAGTYYLGVSTYYNNTYDPAIAGSSSSYGTEGDYTLTITRNSAQIAIDGKKVTVTWIDDNSTADAIRYRAVGTTQWKTTKLRAGVTMYSFTGTAGTSYEIEVLLDQQETNVLKGTAVLLDQPKLAADRNSIKDDTFQVNVTNYTAKNLAANANQAILSVNGVQTLLNLVEQQGSGALTNGGYVTFANGLFTFTGMNSNTQYKVQVSFSDGTSVSTPSTALSVKTLKTCYLAPVLTSATATSDSTINVTWSTAYGKNSNIPAQKYTVQYSLDGVKWTNATTAATGNTFTIQRLKGDCVYQIRVFASKDTTFEASAASNVRSAETLALPKTATEKNSVTDDAFKVNVTNYPITNLPKATAVNVKSDKYGIAVINLQNGTRTATFGNGMTVAFNNGTLTFANAPSNTQQKIQVSFTLGTCTTAWSQALTVKTTAAAYNKPILKDAYAVSSTSIRVEWETVYGKNSTTRAAQKYTVQYSTDGVHWTNATTSATGTSFTIQRLKANTKYLVAVIATKDQYFNASQPSDSKLVTTW